MSTLRIENAIDMHCHFGPDGAGGNMKLDSSAISGLDSARAAFESGHRAIVLKSHSFASPALAATIEQMVPGLRVFGGICTDYPSGGLNIHAIELALRMGARVVWLPTIHSHQDYLNFGGEKFSTVGEGLMVTDASGNPIEALRAIADLVRQHGAVLATGHITAAEHYVVAKSFGRDTQILVTHAGEAAAGPKLTAEQCRELADLGATIELTALSCDHVFGWQGKSPEDMARMVEVIGSERCTLATDYGWSDALPISALGLRDFCERLWSIGMTESQLNTMASKNPARLLAL
jgi:hypothetical protein